MLMRLGYRSSCERLRGLAGCLAPSHGPPGLVHGRKQSSQLARRAQHSATTSNGRGQLAEVGVSGVTTRGGSRVRWCAGAGEEGARRAVERT